jgi:hypothetical protein
MVTEKSEIVYGQHSTTFAGPDAVALFRAMAIRSAIGLYLKTGMKVNRAYTPTNMARAAGQITGKTYSRGKLALAGADLTVWIETMQSALPIRKG